VLETLGEENLVDAFGGHGHTFKCRFFEPSWECYMTAAFSKLNSSKTPALWYSSLDLGYCGNGVRECTWRVVSVDKIVSRTCHTKIFGDVVQATQPSACLDACGSQKNNVSSPCWTDSFNKAALGPESGKPGGSVTGLSMDALSAAWTKPFLPEDQGGCPALPAMRPWFEAPVVEEAEA